MSMRTLLRIVFVTELVGRVTSRRTSQSGSFEHPHVATFLQHVSVHAVPGQQLSSDVRKFKPSCGKELCEPLENSS